jgi:hypothetical protein
MVEFVHHSFIFSDDSKSPIRIHASKTKRSTKGLGPADSVDDAIYEVLLFAILTNLIVENGNNIVHVLRIC